MDELLVSRDGAVATLTLNRLDKPTICALNGAAAGYGMDLALGCDIRVAGASGKLAPAFTKRGVLPESGGTWLLPRIVGWSRACEIAFTGRTLNAEECLAKDFQEGVRAFVERRPPKFEGR